MKTVNNSEELRSAIERYEVLYLNAQDYSLRMQILQTLAFLRERLKGKNRKRI